MSVLVLDTSLVGLLLGLADQSGDIIEAAWYEKPQDAAARLPELCSSLLSRNKVNLNELKKVVVGRGPGSFTGIKIGLAFGQGLALGMPGVAVEGVSSFYRYFEKILQINEVAILPSTASSAYYIQKLTSGIVCGLMRSENEWCLEERSVEGDFVKKGCIQEVRTIHFFQEFSKLQTALEKKLLHLTWISHSLHSESKAVLSGMLSCSIQDLGFSKELLPIYLKKSAPEEKVIA